MVKVQKPTPKTFAKTGQMEEKKKLDKVQKPKLGKSKKITNGSAAPEVVAETKKSKAKLIEKTIKEATLVKPVKKEKKQKNVEEQPEQPKPIAEKKKKQKKQQVAATLEPATPEPKTCPLVLAPPESPAVVVSAAKKTKKPKASKSEAPAAPTAVVADAADDAVAAKKSPTKKQKKAKAATLKVGGGGAVVAPKKPKQPQPALTKMQQKKATKRAFKKQQVQDKRAGKLPKVRGPPAEYTFEPVPYDEDTFHSIVNAQNVQKIAKALKTQVELEVNAKKTSIFSDYQYHLNVANFKIPSCPRRMVKLNLKHSLVGKDDDVVVVVPDLRRGAKVEYDTTIQHYEDLFREAGVEGLKIMPMNQLRNEYSSFEAVRKLANTYDYFMCDGRLVAPVAGFCGKVFQKPRNTFHSLRLDNVHVHNLKAEVEKSLRRTSYKQLHKGDLTSIPVGNHNFTMQELAENVEYVVEQLKTIFPGGLGNVRSLYLHINIAGTTSLPIYMSTAQVAPETPYVVGPREQRMLALKKTANEVLTNFNLTKDGELVKLNQTQVERKRKFKEARAVLQANPTPVLGLETTPKAEVAAAVETSADADAVAATAVAPPSKKARKAAKEEKKPEAVVVAVDTATAGVVAKDKKKKDKKSKKPAKVAKKQQVDDDAEESD